MKVKCKCFIKKLYSLVIIFLINYSTHIGAEDEDIIKEVESLVSQYDKPVILELSNRLIIMANDEDLNGEYYNSIKHYRQAYLLRKYVGVPEDDPSNANLLYLLSLSELHAQAYCDAKFHAEEALKLFQLQKNLELIALVQNELKNLNNECLLAIIE